MVALFYYFVAPLAVLAVVLVASVYYYSRKAKPARRKTKKLVQSYIKEKAKQKTHINKQLANLEKLLKNKSIDKETYERMRKMLIMNEKKQEETTTELIDYVKSHE